MDIDEIKNAVIERFNNLQAEIQAIIMDPNYDKTIADIGKKYSLSPAQVSELELNTTLVLLGQTHPDEYTDEILEDLKLPKDLISQIANDVNEKILKSVRDMIKKNFEDDEKEDEAQEEVPLPPPNYDASDEKVAPVAKKKNLSTDPRIAQLPENMQEAIMASDYKKKLSEIIAKFKLPVGKTAQIEDAMLKLIANTFSVSQFEGTLIFTTGIEVALVKEISHEINEVIINDIKKRAAGVVEEKVEETKKPELKIEEESLMPKLIPKEPAPKTLPVSALPEKTPTVSQKGVFADAGIEMMDDHRHTTSSVIKKDPYHEEI
jgi:hypothetical protein